MDNKDASVKPDSSTSTIEFEFERKDDIGALTEDIYFDTRENQLGSSHSLVNPDPDFWSWTSWIQLLYGIWVNLSFVGIGLSLGFAAVTVPQLESKDSTIKSTEEQTSWIASVTNSASPIGCIVTGFLMDKFGRSWAMVLCKVPQSIGWLYIGMARTASNIIIGRFITGFGCGMAMTPPRVYGAEISLPNMRGVLGTLANFAISVGIVIQATLGSYWSWDLLCYVNAGYVTTLFILNFFLPETPHYQLMKYGEEKAKRSLKKFRSKSYNIDYEMHRLMDYKRQSDIHRITFKEEFKFMIKPMSYRPFLFVIMYQLFAQLSGATIVLLWAVDMLEESKSSIDAHVGNVLLAVARLITGLTITILMFKVGRRKLSIIGTSGVCVSHFILAMHITFAQTKSSLPQLCYTSFIVFCTLSYYNMPMLLMSELYPLQVRGLLSSITVSLTNLFIFIVNRFFTHVHEVLGFANTIFGFALVSFIGTIFLYYNLPETRYFTLHEVEEYYKEKDSVFSAGPFADICKRKPKETRGVTNIFTN